jgi:drug/metabolite transporter (DMT)-like permease
MTGGPVTAHGDGPSVGRSPVIGPSVTGPSNQLPHFLLLAAVVIWGWTFVATKVLVTELGPLEIFALRLALGLPSLGVLLLLRRVPLRFTREDAAPLLLGGGVFTAHFLIQIAGLETTTASSAGWIIAVTPLALAVLSWLFLRERIGRLAVLGIGVATLGILLLVSGGRLADLGWLRSTGDWLILASAHTWAIYTVVTRDLARRRDPLAVTFGVVLVATVLTAVPFAAAADVARIRHLSMPGLIAVVYLAVPALALAQWFWQEGVRRLGAARAGLYLYLEPLATLTLAIPLLGEPFGAAAAIGGALVLGGVWVGQRDRRA